MIPLEQKDAQDLLENIFAGAGLVIFSFCILIMCVGVVSVIHSALGRYLKNRRKRKWLAKQLS